MDPTGAATEVADLPTLVFASEHVFKLEVSVGYFLLVRIFSPLEMSFMILKRCPSSLMPAKFFLQFSSIKSKSVPFGQYSSSKYTSAPSAFLFSWKSISLMMFLPLAY